MAEMRNNGAIANHQRTRPVGQATEMSRGIAERYKAQGFELPLDFLMRQFQVAALDAKDGHGSLEVAIDCAKAALPYVHQKMPTQVVDAAATKHEAALAELDEEDEVLGDNGPKPHSATTVIAEPVTDSQH